MLISSFSQIQTNQGDNSCISWVKHYFFPTLSPYFVLAGTRSAIMINCGHPPVIHSKNLKAIQVDRMKSFQVFIFFICGVCKCYFFADFVNFCQMRYEAHNGYDLKDRASVSEGVESTIGFVSQRKTHSKPVPLDLIRQPSSLNLESVCDGNILTAVKDLLKLKKKHCELPKSKFWEVQRVKKACFELETAF